MYYVYILYSVKFDKYYIGYTSSIERRLLEHNEISENSFTSKYRPWTLAAAFEIGSDRSLAMNIEKHLKKQKSKQYLRNIISKGSIEQIIQEYTNPG